MNAIFTYNFVNKTIVGTKSAINRANMGKNPEYTTLCEMLSAHPDFAVVEKQIKRDPDKIKSAQPKPYRGSKINRSLCVIFCGLLRLRRQSRMPTPPQRQLHIHPSLAP